MATPSKEGKGRTPNWDDLRFALALSQTKKAAKAAETLGVDSSTVLRRVKNLEELLEISVFYMEGHEYFETEDGKCVVRAAERMAAEVQTMEDQLGEPQPLSGSLRVMMPEDLAAGIFDATIADFCRSYPDLRLNLLMQSRNVSLSLLEADAAVQMMPPRDEACEQGKKLCEIDWSCYATLDYLQQKGRPEELRDLEQHALIVPSDRPRVERWLRGLRPSIQTHFRATSLFTIRQMAVHELGIAILPCFVGGYDVSLMCLFAPIPELSEELWIVSHQDLRRTPRVQAFFDIFGRLPPEVIGRIQTEERLPPRTRIRGIASYLPENES